MAEKSSNNQDVEFSRLALLYLEDRHSQEQLHQLHTELAADPVKRKLFVDLCLTRQGLVRLLRKRAQYREESLRGELDSGKPAADALAETMILPAVKLADGDRTDEQEIFPPSAIEFIRVQPIQWWKRPAVIAAAVLLPVLSGVLVWHFSTASLPTGGVAKTSPDQTQEQLPARTTPPTTAPVVAIVPHTSPDIPRVAPEVGIPKVAMTTVGIALNDRWDHSGQAMGPGSELKAGVHSLDQGVAQINLAGGASVVVQAPASFEIQSGASIKLTQGQLSAVVPHGSAKLTVRTPDLVAVDLGTEFGIKVAPRTLTTHLEVFVGQVRAELANASAGTTIAKIVSAGQSVAVQTGSSSIETDRPAPLEFIRSDELKDRAASGGDVALKRWESFSQILRRDPDLVAYYTFDNEADAPMKLLNRSLATIGRHDGTLGSATGANPLWSKGRWGKGALQFGDRGETAVHIPANENLIQTKAFSAAFWVKRSELTRSVHLLNQAFDGSRCFNVNIVGTAGRKESGLKPNSLYFDFGEGSQTAAVATLPAGGEWFFVTLTLGADNETHVYIDGKFVGGNLISIPDMTRTGDLYLGKTSDQDTADVATQDVFHGWMDELAIFRRTLSDIEVQRMYDAGKPE